MNILVVLEDNRGQLHRMSKEAITGAQKIGGDITALAIGPNAQKIAESLLPYDLHEILVVNTDAVSSYSAEGYSEVVCRIINDESPKIILAGHSYQTRDFMPRVSARLNIPFIPDVISMSENGYVKQVLNSKLNGLISYNSEKVIVSFQSSAFSGDDLRVGSCSVRKYDFIYDASLIKTESEEPFQEEVGDIDLENAELLVSVGRGIEKKENVKIAFELAKVLGAEVSASRPVVDAEWIESFRQVGSSGSNVAPKLYFSIGISGAIQHVVGMKGAKSIIAINKDKDAPIFEIADYAVIGDVLEIVPKITEAIKNI